MSNIEAQGIQVAYDHKVILENLSSSITHKKITTIIGANGCGKSTFLKALTRIQPLQKGNILLDGHDIALLPTKQVAQKIALLPQLLETSTGISVFDLVSYGRYPHQSYFGRLSKEDHDKIYWAMEATRIADFSQLEVDALSGGQRQRVWIAMALAQDTDTIFLDEPTTYLDMNHQLEILELLQELNLKEGKTIIMVLHDLNLASRFSDQLIAMKDGEIRYQGRVETIMTSDILQEIFDINAHLTHDPISQKPILLSYQLLK